HIHHRDLHSFPTRRSSDLLCGGAAPERSAAGSSDLVEIRPWVVDESLTLNVWDFAGVSCRELFPLFVSERTIYLLTVSLDMEAADRKSTRLNSSHVSISYA